MLWKHLVAVGVSVLLLSNWARAADGDGIYELKLIVKSGVNRWVTSWPTSQAFSQPIPPGTELYVGWGTIGEPCFREWRFCKIGGKFKPFHESKKLTYAPLNSDLFCQRTFDGSVLVFSGYSPGSPQAEGVQTQTMQVGIQDKNRCRRGVGWN